MLGSFAPGDRIGKLEWQEAPGGLLGRGTYTGKCLVIILIKFIDEEGTCHF